MIAGGLKINYLNQHNHLVNFGWYQIKSNLVDFYALKLND